MLEENYDPEKHARIRILFKSTEYKTWLYPGRKCTTPHSDRWYSIDPDDPDKTVWRSFGGNLVLDILKAREVDRNDDIRIVAHSGGKTLVTFNKYAVFEAIPSAYTWSRRIGMPKTNDMTKRYHEFVIPANEPLTIESELGGGFFSPGFFNSPSWVGWRCGPVAVTFVPEAGKDYDSALLYFIKEGHCGIRVRQLADPDPIPVDVEKAVSCSLYRSIRER